MIIDNIIIKDNSEEVIRRINNQIEQALELCGDVAEGYAKRDCPVDTGALRNSITYTVQDNVLAVGTNMEYAPYIEFGTGVYAEKGGRMTSWTYKDARGNFHKTKGMRPQPFLKPALANHISEFQNIFKMILKG